jgi:hypothetical protein
VRVPALNNKLWPFGSREDLWGVDGESSVI